MDCCGPGSSVHGIFQAGILEWVPLPSPGHLLLPGMERRYSALQEDSLPTEPAQFHFVNEETDVIASQYSLTQCGIKTRLQSQLQT